MTFRDSHEERVVISNHEEDILLITLFHLAKGEKRDMQFKTTEGDITRFCRDMKKLYPKIFEEFVFCENGDGLCCELIKGFLSRLNMPCQKLHPFIVPSNNGAIILSVNPASGIYAKFFLANPEVLPNGYMVNIHNAVQKVKDNLHKEEGDKYQYVFSYKGCH
jgi:hypothetical protein